MRHAESRGCRVEKRASHGHAWGVVLCHGNFTSVQHLQTQILAFIAYYNRTMAQPFRWTYQRSAQREQRAA